MGAEPEEYIDLVEKRAGILRALRGGERELRAVEDRTGVSRSTVNRAVRSLESAGLVENVGGAYALTAVGRLALDHYETYRRDWTDLFEARAVLEALPRDAPITMDAVAGGDAVASPAELPYEPVERLRATVESATTYRAALPALSDPREFTQLYEHVVTDGDAAALVVPPDLRSSMAEAFPQRLAAMAERDGFDLFVGDVPAYGLVLTEDDEGTTLTVVVFGDAGGIGGLVENDDDRAVEWAEECYESLRTAADCVTDDLAQTTDGGVTTASDAGAAGADLPLPLPVALERQGFVRVDRSYFVDSTVRDPTDAWRAGLDLAEVHAGYAVERTDEDGEPLVDRLTGALAAGTDCALVGPAGSGKSTTAKQVACEWYRTDRGTVLYREGDAGRPVTAVSELVAVAESAPGHTLVVVEDAVRPDADGVIAALDRVSGDDVSVLLDARESEWRDPPGDAPVAEVDLRAETISTLSAAESRRLVDHVEATTGATVETPVAQLREGIRDGGGDGDAPVGETYLLLHRLSLSLDPVSDGRTSLESDVADAYDAVANAGSAALDAATTAALFVAAGVDPNPAALRAVAAGSETDPGAEAVDDALDRLDGRILFGREDGRYRTVHETWATAFLDHLLEVAGETAARDRVGNCLSTALSLAGDPDRLDRLRGVVGDRPVERIEAGPATWADGVVEAAFVMGRNRPRLAPLLGDADGPVVTLPPACESVTAADCWLWLGAAFLNQGTHERALSVFEDAPATARPVARLLGRSRARQGIGDTDEAIADAERALEQARDRDDPADIADALVTLGEAHQMCGAYEAASERVDRAIAVAQECGDRRTEADALHQSGNLALFQGEYDRARERYEAALTGWREVGDRRGEGKTLGNLGAVALYESEYTTAAEYFRQSLTIATAIGDRRSESVNLANLGDIAKERGAYERAREHYEDALAIQTDLGLRQKRANSLASLGMVLNALGDHERAHERLERSLEIRRDVDDTRGESINLYQLGEVTYDRGAYDRARGYFRQSRETAASVGDEEGEAAARYGLGKVARQAGDDETAREHLAAADEAYDALGAADYRARVLRQRGLLAADRDDYEAARDRLSAALDALADLDAPDQALDVIDSLVDIERAAGNEAAAREWCDRALDRIADTDVPLEERRRTFADARADLAQATTRGGGSGDGADADGE